MGQGWPTFWLPPQQCIPGTMAQPTSTCGEGIDCHWYPGIVRLLGNSVFCTIAVCEKWNHVNIFYEWSLNRLAMSAKLAFDNYLAYYSLLPADYKATTNPHHVFEKAFDKMLMTFCWGCTVLFLLRFSKSTHQWQWETHRRFRKLKPPKRCPLDTLAVLGMWFTGMHAKIHITSVIL